MDGPVVKITKMDTPSKIPVKPVEDPKLDGGKKTKKTTKTYPRGILKTSKVKIKAVSDPAKHPPLKKFMKKHTIRMLTESGSQHRRKTIKKKIDRMTDMKVKDMVIKAGLSKGSGPPGLLRQILEGGMMSGFISSG
jgi:hypothetical protein